jgi:hypothetical protein
VLAPDFFNEKIIKLKEIKSETNKKERNTLCKIVSGRYITETAKQVKQHVENQRKKKPKDRKPGPSPSLIFCGVNCLQTQHFSSSSISSSVSGSVESESI